MDCFILKTRKKFKEEGVGIEVFGKLLENKFVIAVGHAKASDLFDRDNWMGNTIVRIGVSHIGTFRFLKISKT